MDHTGAKAIQARRHAGSSTHPPTPLGSKHATEYMYTHFYTKVSQSRAPAMCIPAAQHVGHNTIYQQWSHMSS